MRSGKRFNDRDRTAKSRKNQKARRKGKILVFGNIEKAERKEKNKKIVSQENISKKALQIKSPQKDKHLGCSSYKIRSTILAMDERNTSTNWPEDKRVKDDA